jgi:hypothetical protein
VRDARAAAADDEAPGFGSYAEPVLELLEEDSWVKHIDGR